MAENVVAEVEQIDQVIVKLKVKARSILERQTTMQGIHLMIKLQADMSRADTPAAIAEVLRGFVARHGRPFVGY